MHSQRGGEQKSDVRFCLYSHWPFSSLPRLLLATAPHRHALLFCGTKLVCSALMTQAGSCQIAAQHVHWIILGPSINVHTNPQKGLSQRGQLLNVKWYKQGVWRVFE